MLFFKLYREKNSIKMCRLGHKWHWKLGSNLSLILVENRGSSLFEGEFNSASRYSGFLKNLRRSDFYQNFFAHKRLKTPELLMAKNDV